jgi:Fe-S-cluster-containing hydrogenase components 2
MHKDPVSGAIIVDVKKCIGCWTCIIACPYGVLTRNISSKSIVKCDLCPGRDIPACVANCPNEALICVEVQDESLTKKARQLVRSNG